MGLARAALTARPRNNRDPDPHPECAPFLSNVAEPLVILDLSRDPDGRCPIEVRDNGVGIPEERPEDVFLPFYTTHEGGSGIGLSFSKQVALAHGGSICALAAPEGGATIRLVI